MPIVTVKLHSTSFYKHKQQNFMKLPQTKLDWLLATQHPIEEDRTLRGIACWAQAQIDYHIPGWDFTFSNSKVKPGGFRYTPHSQHIGCITLSKRFVLNKNVSHFWLRVALAHQICHAKVGGGETHGTDWVEQMCSMGLPPFRELPYRFAEGKYRMVCPSCGETVSMHRRTRVFRKCKACGLPPVVGSFNRPQKLSDVLAQASPEV